jgi:hypothetical protein
MSKNPHVAHHRQRRARVKLLQKKSERRIRVRKKKLERMLVALEPFAAVPEAPGSARLNWP